MGQNSILKARGLFTNPNMLSLMPEGGMLIARNAVMTRDGIIQPRRGLGRKLDGLGNGGWQLSSTAGVGKRWKSMRTHFYNGREFNSMKSCNTDYTNYESGLETFEFYINDISDNGYERFRYRARMAKQDANIIPGPVDNEIARARFVNANSNCYFTNNLGVVKIDGYPPSTSDFYGWGTVGELAGVPQATDIVSGLMKIGTTTGIAGTGMLAQNTARAFRVCWARKDGNGNEIIGIPSGRQVVVNPQYEISLSRGAATTTCVATCRDSLGNAINWVQQPGVGDQLTILSTDVTKFGSSPAGSYFVVTAVSATTVTYTDTAIAAPAGAQTIAHVIGGNNSKMGYGTRPVNLKINVPYWVRNHIYTLRVYMSAPSATWTSEPSDEMFLVYESTDSRKMMGRYKVNLSRVANVVTATIPTGSHTPPYAATVPDTFVLTSSDAAFPPGTKNVASVTATTIVYNEVGANATTTDQEIEGLVTAFGWNRADQRLDITIITADALRGAPLYTNPSQEGILQGNGTPPLCKDMAIYKGHMFFANTQQRGRIIFRLLSTDSTLGMNDADTLRINTGTTLTLTATASTQNTAGSFIRATGGTASQNVIDTAHNMVRAINEYGGPDAPGSVLAYYLSGTNDPPGIIAIELRELGQTYRTSFTAANNTTSEYITLSCSSTSRSYYEPEIRPRSQIDSAISLSTITKTGTTVQANFSGSHGLNTGDVVDVETTSGTTYGPRIVTVISASSIQFEDTFFTTGTTSLTAANFDFYRTTIWSNLEYGPNRLYYSKQNEPEHVPYDNYMEIGSEQYAIVRIFPLADTLWVLKEDGVYRVTGATVDEFDWSEFDLTVKIIAPESVASVSNQLFFLSNSGPVACTDTGVVKVGRPVEQDILKLYADAPEAVRNASTACSYESEGLYILCMPDVDTDSASAVNSIAWVYNVFSSGGVWSQWDAPWTSCMVHPDDDILVAGDEEGSFLLMERKSRTAADYADKAFRRDGEGNMTDNVITVTSASGSTLILDDSVPGYEVGDVIYVSDAIRAKVTAVTNSTTVVVETSTGSIASFSGQTVAVFKHIPFEAMWQPVMGENPGESKLFSECALELRRPFFSAMKVGFVTDKSPTFEKFQLTGYARRGNQADFPWDYDEFEGEQGVKTMRCPIPRKKSRATKLFIKVEHTAALEFFQLQGVHVKFSGGGKADK